MDIDIVYMQGTQGPKGTIYITTLFDGRKVDCIISGLWLKSARRVAIQQRIGYEKELARIQQIN